MKFGHWTSRDWDCYDDCYDDYVHHFIGAYWRGIFVGITWVRLSPWSRIGEDRG